MFFMNSDTPINDIGFGKKISGKLPLFSFSQSPGIAGSYSWLANGPANLSVNAASKKETKRGCDLRCLVEQCCWGRSIRSYTEGPKSTHRDIETSTRCVNSTPPRRKTKKPAASDNEKPR